MTTVTSADTLYRVDALRSVDAHVRALSIEPLWTAIADSLDLNGIDWVIVGGESGTLDRVTPFHVEWAEGLRHVCSEAGVAFFVKQLGRNPTRNGCRIVLKDKHGGNWDEWDEPLRVREAPEYFHLYRQAETVQS